jgi:hypothetical protein
LATGEWTEAEAESVRFRAMPTLPVELALAKPKPWPACLSLGLTHATAVSLAQMVSELILPACTSLEDPAQLHLSLYRGFGISAALKEQLKLLEPHLNRTTSFGTICGTRVAIKKRGIYFGYHASAGCRTVY